MNNVIDEVLDTTQTDNKIKYRITHADSTYEIVEISLETPVTTEGTALNKALFDSIQADLNTRLLISSKANQGDAQAGTDDTKYMTPKTVLDEIKKLGYPSYNMSIKSGTISNGATIPKTSGYSHYFYFVNNYILEDLRTSYSGSGSTDTEIRLQTYVNQSTRAVTCRGAYKKINGSSSYSYVNGTANYFEIAWN